MPVAGLHPICFGDIVDYDLHGRITVFIFAHPVDDKVTVTTVDTVLITVYHQAVVIGIALQIAVLHIVVVIDPLHWNTVGRHRTQDIRITVTIQVYITLREQVAADKGSRGYLHSNIPFSRNRPSVRKVLVHSAAGNLLPAIA